MVSLAPPGWALPSRPSPAAAVARRRCGSRCPGRAPAPPARPRRGVLGGAALSAGTALPRLFFWPGFACFARRRPAVHLRPPRAQPRGRLAGVREGADSPPGRSLGEPRRFGFPLGDAQYHPPTHTPPPPSPSGGGRCALLPQPSESPSPGAAAARRPRAPSSASSAACRFAFPFSAAGRVLRGRQRGKRMRRSEDGERQSRLDVYLLNLYYLKKFIKKKKVNERLTNPPPHTHK